MQVKEIFVGKSEAFDKSKRIKISYFWAQGLFQEKKNIFAIVERIHLKRFIYPVGTGRNCFQNYAGVRAV